MTAPFATVAELAEYSQGKLSAGDPRLGDVLAGASHAIRRYCGWHVAPEMVEEFVLDGPGGRILALPTLRLVEVTAATDSGRALDVGALEWSHDGTVRGYWHDRFRGVKITARHGFESAPEIKQMVLAACSRALSSPSGATREQAGALSVSWATVAPGVSGGLALLAHELALLETYRLEPRV